MRHIITLILLSQIIPSSIFAYLFLIYQFNQVNVNVSSINQLVNLMYFFIPQCPILFSLTYFLYPLYLYFIYLIQLINFK